MLGHRTCRSSSGLVFSIVSGFVMLNINLRPLLDVHVGTLNLSLQGWTCRFEAGPAAQIYFDIKLIKLILALDLRVGIVDLSPQDWTCHFEAALNIKLGMFLDLHVGTFDFSVQHWTCHFEAGPSAQLHNPPVP